MISVYGLAKYRRWIGPSFHVHMPATCVGVRDSLSSWHSFRGVWIQFKRRQQRTRRNRWMLSDFYAGRKPRAIAPKNTEKIALDTVLTLGCVGPYIVSVNKSQRLITNPDVTIVTLTGFHTWQTYFPYWSWVVCAQTLPAQSTVLFVMWCKCGRYNPQQLK